MTQIDERDTAPIYWEPWAPVVGQRVRMRLSGECDHAPVELLHGKLGTVVKVIEQNGLIHYRDVAPGDPLFGTICVKGHRFVVEPDLASEGNHIFLAAAELESLDQGL